MTKIIIEVDKATEGQVKSLIADVAMTIDPWKRFIKYKIKSSQLSIIHTEEVVSDEETPLTAIKNLERGKKILKQSKSNSYFKQRNDKRFKHLAYHLS